MELCEAAQFTKLAVTGLAALPRNSSSSSRKPKASHSKVHSRGSASACTALAPGFASLTSALCCAKHVDCDKTRVRSHDLRWHPANLTETQHTGSSTCAAHQITASAQHAAER